MKSALEQIPVKIQELLYRYEKALQETWDMTAESGTLSISFPVKVGFDKKGSPMCEVGISFVKESVKDSTIFSWDDKQLPLPKMNGGKI